VEARKPSLNNKGNEMIKELATTPDQVRKALKKAGVPYNIEKHGSSWYVFGPGSYCWPETCLCTFTFSGLPAEEWADRILSMVKDNSKNMIQSWDALEPQERDQLAKMGIQP